MRIKKHHPIVIKYGGSLLEKDSLQRPFFKNLAWLSNTKGVVIVHGGGKEITLMLKKCGIATRFVKGLRFTDKATADVVEMVLSGRVNKDIVVKLNKAGASAVGVSCRDNNMIIARQIKELGRVGKPREVQVKLLHWLLDAGFLPVVSPVGSDEKGAVLNINADDAACALAIALKAHQLIYLTDVPGILDEKGKRIPVISISHIDALIADGTITGGMLPKLRSAAQAIQKGVREVDIIQGGRTISFKKGTRIVP